MPRSWKHRSGNDTGCLASYYKGHMMKKYKSVDTPEKGGGEGSLRYPARGNFLVPKNRYSVLAKISYVRWGFRNLTKDYITSFLYKESPYFNSIYNGWR